MLGPDPDAPTGQSSEVSSGSARSAWAGYRVAYSGDAEREDRRPQLQIEVAPAHGMDAPLPIRWSRAAALRTPAVLAVTQDPIVRDALLGSSPEAQAVLADMASALAAALQEDSRESDDDRSLVLPGLLPSLPVALREGPADDTSVAKVAWMQGVSTWLLDAAGALNCTTEVWSKDAPGAATARIMGRDVAVDTLDAESNPAWHELEAADGIIRSAGEIDAWGTGGGMQPAYSWNGAADAMAFANAGSTPEGAIGALDSASGWKVASSELLEAQLAVSLREPVIGDRVRIRLNASSAGERELLQQTSIEVRIGALAMPESDSLLGFVQQSAAALNLARLREPSPLATGATHGSAIDRISGWTAFSSSSLYASAVRADDQGVYELVVDLAAAAS